MLSCTLNRCRSTLASRAFSTKLVQTKGPLGKYVYNDPFLMSSQLTSDERQIQEAARDYCQSELMPRIIMANRNEVFDRSIMKVRKRLVRVRCNPRCAWRVGCVDVAPVLLFLSFKITDVLEQEL
jgi:hypothetical protein